MSNLKNLIPFFLIAIIIALVAYLVWQNKEREVEQKNILTLQADITTATNASKSCDESLLKLIAKNKKRNEILTRFKAKIAKERGHAKIDTINNFIAHANSLQ